jgi:hypothetical protein
MRTRGFSEKICEQSKKKRTSCVSRVIKDSINLLPSIASYCPALPIACRVLPPLFPKYAFFFQVLG